MIATAPERPNGVALYALVYASLPALNPDILGSNGTSVIFAWVGDLRDHINTELLSGDERCVVNSAWGFVGSLTPDHIILKFLV